MPQLVLATANAGKIAEFAGLLSPLGWTVRPQGDFAVPECPEPHPSFVENALAKARHAAQHTGLPALADDSGLCVKALGGAPGVRSARYACDDDNNPNHAKDDAANNAKLLRQLQGVDARQAYFTCALVAVKHPQDPEPLIAIGRWHGYIAGQLSGSNGFGYDPLFVCGAHRQSAAAMAREQKAAVSHRGLATAQLLELIKTAW